MGEAPLLYVLGMINILSWNVRGLNGLNKQREVKLLCNELEVGLIGLLETKIKSNRIDAIADNMFGGWKIHTNHLSHYNGRVCMIWREDMYEVTKSSENSQAITCLVKYETMHIRFLITFVYTHNLKEERKELWEYLNQLRKESITPWIVLGDFNSVLHREDRIGGNTVTLSEVVDFQECL